MESEVIETEEVAEEVMEEAAIEEETTQETEVQEEVTEEDQAEREQQETEKKPWFQKRIDTITKQKLEAMNEVAAGKERESELEKKLAELSASKHSADEPRIEDFDTDAEFIKASIAWNLKAEKASIQQETEKERQDREQKQAQDSFVANIIKVNDDGRAKFEDYDRVIAVLPPDVMDNDLAGLIIETDTPEEIAYHLGKNPEEAARISKLPPRKKALALGRIENRISLSKQKSSSAPPPIKPVKGVETGGFDPDKLLEENPKEWIRLRNEGKI